MVGPSDGGDVKAVAEMEVGPVLRCRAEIRTIEALLLAGHPDVEGLCLALLDWSAELRILEGAEAGPPPDY